MKSLSLVEMEKVAAGADSAIGCAVQALGGIGLIGGIAAAATPFGWALVGIGALALTLDLIDGGSDCSDGGAY